MCYTETGYDFLRFYRDEAMEEQVGEYSGGGPWEGLEADGDRLWYSFTSEEGCEQWGYSFTVSADTEAPGAHGRRNFEVGERVEGLYWGKWYGAVVAEVLEDGRYLLDWDDEEQEDRKKRPEQLRKKGVPHDADVPQVLLVFSPNGACDVAGSYELVPERAANGYPMWKKTDDDRWIYAMNNGMWGISDRGAWDKGFDTDEASIYCPVQHGGRMPDRLQYVVWERLEGGEWVEDSAITITTRNQGATAHRKIVVTGCKRDNIQGKMMRGTYVRDTEFHGKPVYKRVEGETPDPTVIYYWDDRDGPSYNGWWFGPELGSDEQYAFNPKFGDTPPARGWEVPAGNGVDETVVILPEEATTATASTPRSTTKESPARLFAEGGVHLGGDGALLFLGGGPAGVQRKPLEPEPSFLVRHSLTAMRWLRPGVLAGEVTVDFTGAPLTKGDLAVGLAVSPPARLAWPDARPVAITSQESGAIAHDVVGSVATDCSEEAPQGEPVDGVDETEEMETREVPEETEADQAEQEDCDGSGARRPEAAVPGAWWWRCDGAALAAGAPPSAARPEAAFGAGDVLGLVVQLDPEARCLKRLELFRNGVRIDVIDCTGESGLQVPQGDEGVAGLALCAAVRRSPCCLSLPPGPALLGAPAAAEGTAEAELDGWETQAATAVFSALDVGGDGVLDREEVTEALGGARGELFEALESAQDGKVSLEGWLLYCRRAKCAGGAGGLGLLLGAFRKKLLHVGRRVVFSQPLSRSNSGVVSTVGAWGVRVTATPRELTPQGALRAAREVAPEELAEFSRLAAEGWTREADAELVAVAEWLAERVPGLKDQGGPCALHCGDMDRIQVERQKAFPALAEPSARLAARLVVLRTLNTWIRDRVLPLCDVGAIRTSRFGQAISDARGLLFSPLKFDRFSQVVEATFTDAEGSIRLDRQLAIACSQAEECDTSGERMIFAQASKAAESLKVDVFRSRGGSFGRPLRISFKNEGGIDQGGVYRDFLDTCATELMSPNLPLLMPTPNAQNNTGECREAWTFTPGPTTAATRRMLRFLGRLMGVCVRRGDVLPLSLPPASWKLLVGDEPTLEDLACVDVAAAESLRQLFDVESSDITPEEFDARFGEMYFVFHNSALAEVPLVEGGEGTRLSYDNAGRFARLAAHMRLHEASEQVECVRSGMASVVPIGCFSLWSWRDLELRVCGDPEIDIAVLRRHTTYTGGLQETDIQVQHLWKVLESFDQQDRQRFTRFCWGRSRLPREGSTTWGQGFIVSGARDLPENGLPRAHTCYFQLDLPRYDSRRRLRERLIFAIRNCVSVQNA